MFALFCCILLKNATKNLQDLQNTCKKNGNSKIVS